MFDLPIFDWNDLDGPVVWMCFVKKVLANILQNSQENTCTRASFSLKLPTCMQLY